MNISTITASLSGLPVSQVRYFDVIGSTNDEAIAWAATGAADGCLVVADQQTRGRGRLGRRWITNPGAALAFSLILRPNLAEQKNHGFFTALAAMAVCQALEKTAGLTAQIKWPNDVLLERKKTAGILVEASWVGDQIHSLVIGVGINITRQAVPPAGELLFPATSIEENVGRSIDRLDLLRAILRELFEWRARLPDDAFRKAWEDRLAFKGEWVKIEQSGSHAGGEVSGQLIGLGDSGSLVLRRSSGEIIEIAAGDLHLRPAE